MVVITFKDVVRVTCQRPRAVCAPAFPFLLRGSRPLEILFSDRRGCGRLAGLCAHQQRRRSWSGRTCAIHSDRDPGVRRGPCRRPLRSAPRGADLAADCGARGGVPGLGQLRGMDHRTADLCRGRGVRSRHRLREPRGGRDPARRRPRGDVATGGSAVDRRVSDGKHLRAGAGRPRSTRWAPAYLTR